MEIPTWMNAKTGAKIDEDWTITEVVKAKESLDVCFIN